MFSTISVLISILITFIFLYHYLIKIINHNKVSPPEPAWGWPLIGHLHLLLGGSTQLLHRKLGSLADKYGPVFTIRLGMKRLLVISNAELAKECYSINDRFFVTRPTSVAVQLMGYNYALMGFSPYGSYWREMRKLSTTHLLSNSRLEILKHIRISEISMSIQELYQLWVENQDKGEETVVGLVAPPVLVEMKSWFEGLAFNVVVRMIAGKRYFGRNNNSNDEEKEEGRRSREGMNEFMHYSGLFMISDAFPFLGSFDLQGYEKEMKKAAMKIDDVLGKWVDDHRKKSDNHQDQDFIDSLLSNLKDDELKMYGYDVDTAIKGTCMSLILGGNDTTSTTLTWALSLLLNNSHVIHKAQEELDIHVGRDRQIEESDIKNLVYLQAIVKEALRLYPAAPLPVPRMSVEDCTVGRYHIPKGTQLMINIWKLHRDPLVWSDPLEFKPERFLSNHKDIDVRGQHFELLPFGAGRRACPGISFSIQVLHLTLARLLQGFHMSTLSNLPVDMTESAGLGCTKATPLDVLLTPRLPSLLYQP